MVRVTVRVSWTSERDKRTALRIADEIAEAYRAKRYRVRKSKIYLNRKNKGGRIYITVERRSQPRREPHPA